MTYVFPGRSPGLLRHGHHRSSIRRRRAQPHARAGEEGCGGAALLVEPLQPAADAEAPPPGAVAVAPRALSLPPRAPPQVAVSAAAPLFGGEEWERMR